MLRDHSKVAAGLKNPSKIDAHGVGAPECLVITAVLQHVTGNQARCIIYKRLATRLTLSAAG